MDSGICKFTYKALLSIIEITFNGVHDVIWLKGGLRVKRFYIKMLGIVIISS